MNIYILDLINLYKENKYSLIRPYKNSFNDPNYIYDGPKSESIYEKHNDITGPDYIYDGP